MTKTGIYLNKVHHCPYTEDDLRRTEYFRKS